MNHVSRPSRFFFRFSTTRLVGLFLTLALVTGLGLWGIGDLHAQEATPAVPTPAAQPVASPLHPTFSLLDANGENVLTSGLPLSTMQTCGTCHNTAFIASHNFHVNVGLDTFSAPGTQPGGQPWEMSNGLYGGWDPITYRYLTPSGDELYDLGVADWVKLYGQRHVGGGPATTAPDGTPLADVAVVDGDPITHSYDPTTGTLSVWDWTESGVEEMNCFLCHMADPDLDARSDELAGGNFGWANTATLANTDIVLKEGEGWIWNPDAFTADGELSANRVFIQDPAPDNCGTCHGTVHTGATPLLPGEITEDDLHTLHTGQIFTGQRIMDTGLNVENKGELSRSYDIHAERNVACNDCHFAVNNPIYHRETDASRPDHLTFDPRRLDYDYYLVQPEHNFARGETAQDLVSPQYADSMRRCESCHDAQSNHDWLPYTDLHLSALSCESCHIPQLYAPTLEQMDWTVIQPDGAGLATYRGVDGDVNDLTSLITGYEPVLMLRTGVDGESQLAPFNLVTTYFWTYGDPVRPVRLEDLRRVYLTDDGAGDTYRPQILAIFDGDGNGQLDEIELRLDSTAKVELVQAELSALGLTNPQIQGEVQSNAISHNVTNGTFATGDCRTCHIEDSRLNRPFQVVAYSPGGVSPQFPQASGMGPVGELMVGENSTVNYIPDTAALGFYLPGYNRVEWVGWVGLSAFMLTLAGVFVHGGLRVYQAGRRVNRHHPAGTMHEFYMYSYYERAWHWLQTIVILLLLATGTIIHRPDTLGFMDLGLVVPIHNVLAVLLLANALFAAFYHFASGQIRQYLPEPVGYFPQMLTQAEYYLRGIFRGDPHPFQKLPGRKLNPLQQVTYLVILNVLLPLQVITGILMWGVQEWPILTARLGGLPWLAPFHTLIAWFFATFVVLHVYLITTGHTPTAALKAMTVGWEKVELIDENNNE
ncbi:MAG: cytochrome b/b6 domain-containing protein [Caldilineaceae bacterium]|nr:cytochrome b/b6 domain-containing protein [Caldilineaceae bacterium]MBP8109719.1 cytochrome b/b6 domain-containing protein [Caldilineaceae bacterium]MBP8123466.1 cytochrome b/b6 domain-containing protein [Caldilineaceae bacterium]MBP9071670.1 cytochrome b/b6 domain-containing protein [Caldilineaceae bacterium]